MMKMGDILDEIDIPLWSGNARAGSELDANVPSDRERKIANLKCTHDVWHERISIIIPRYAAYDPAYIELRGMCYSEDFTEQDIREFNSEPVKVWRSAIRQIKLFEDGIPIAYPDRVAASRMYRNIQQHISNWVDLIGERPYLAYKAPPDEDLELMLEFSSSLELYLGQFMEHESNKFTHNAFRRKTTNTLLMGSIGDNVFYDETKNNLIHISERRLRTDDGSGVKSKRITHDEDSDVCIGESGGLLGLKGGRPE